MLLVNPLANYWSWHIWLVHTDNGLINSKPAHPSPLLSGIFCFLFSTVGICQRRSAQGQGIVKNKGAFHTLRVLYGSTLTFANICATVSTCEREMTKRRLYTVLERVAVLAVKKQFELLQYTFKYHAIIAFAGWSFALFQKPHHGAFVRLSWSHHRAFATILKSKDKCGQMSD